MGPYIICTILSCFLTFVGTRIKYRSFNNFFFALAIFCPCFLAAVRDSTIGTDVALYGDRVFMLAQNMSLPSLIKTTNQEPLFLLLAYITAKYGNRYIYYFVLQFLVVAPLYFTILRKNTRKKAWLGMLIYFMWLYGYTLNLMRQTIAIAIIIFGTKYILENRNIKYMLSVLVAMGFHSTGILGFIPLFMYKLLVYEGNIRSKNRSISFNGKSLFNISAKSFDWFKKKYSILFKGLYVLLVVGIVLAGSRIIQLVYILTGKFGYQVNHISGSFDFNLTYFIAMGFIALFLYRLLKIQRIEKMAHNQLYMLLIICGIILFQLMGISFQMYRVSLYFTSYMIVFLPYVFMNKRRNLSYWIYLSLILILMSYLIYRTIILKGWNGIYPYTSIHLGIK